MRFSSLRSLAGVDAQQHVVGGGVVLAEVMGVAGGHQRQAELVGDVDRPLGAAASGCPGRCSGSRRRSSCRRRRGTTRPACSASSSWSLRMNSLNSPEAQPLRQMMPFLVGFQQFLVDARDVVIAFEEGDGGHLDRGCWKPVRFWASSVRWIAGVAAPAGLAFGALAGGDVGLVADDRVEAGRLALAGRTRWRRRGCRGRSGPGRSCPAPWRGPTSSGMRLAPSSRL